MSETKPQSGDVKPSFSKASAFLGFTTVTLGSWAAACAVPEATLAPYRAKLPYAIVGAGFVGAAWLGSTVTGLTENEKAARWERLAVEKAQKEAKKSQ